MKKIYSFQTISLTEAYDDDKGIATITVIESGFNKSKSRFYPADVLKRDAGVFAGAKMFLNHQTEAEAKQRPEGDLRNWVGSIQNLGVVEADGKTKIQGQAVIIDPEFKEKLSLLKKAGLLSEMGVSIRAEGQARPMKENGQSYNHVESISKARSVDFVTYPGAGGRVNMLEADSFSDERREENKMQLTEAEVTKLQADLATATAALATANTLAATNKTQLDTLTTKIAESEKATRVAVAQTEVEKQLKESKLPKPAQDRIRAQFKDAEETTKVAAAITAEVAYIKEVGGKQGVTNLGESHNNADEKPAKVDWTLVGFKKEEVEKAGL